MVPAAQQLVLDPGGIPSNRLFIPEDKVAVPLVQADVRRCRKERRRVRAALLWASQRSQRQANRHRTPAPYYQPDQKVCLPTKDLPFQTNAPAVYLAQWSPTTGLQTGTGPWINWYQAAQEKK
ncbi:hypothetical protein D4764_01G0016430 [Takifugu flavidus]|uniref:Uncharacterized protein n=1 Tax=Takifugu flavidus TaxID=433684 RepID=A0A5C6PST6_9TELE|nr:hypothetical protein D4764_01G0016430 [Takifugu flavidus]